MKFEKADLELTAILRLSVHVDESQGRYRQVMSKKSDEKESAVELVKRTGQVGLNTVTGIRHQSPQNGDHCDVYGIVKNPNGSIDPNVYQTHKEPKQVPHETFGELEAGIYRRFRDELRKKQLGNDPRMEDQFRVFCFKHDLEALILASEEELKNRLDTKTLIPTWQIPVEDQDHDHPPKRVVEKLFETHNKRYRDTVDAPVILGAGKYLDIADHCPQCFKPFVEFLGSLSI